MRPDELLLHPVRLRVVQAFLGGRLLTTADLAAELPDVPTASLYRNVALLAEAGVLAVAEERRVRGAVERRYGLVESAASVDAEAAAQMSVERHRQAFTTFVLGLLGTFTRYLERDDVDLGRDLVGYRQVAMHLTDEELTALLDDLRAVVAPRLALPPSPERRRRVLTTVLLPD